jgi:hypothetical protein
MPDKPTPEASGDERQTAAGETPTTWSEFVKAHPEAQALHDAETAGLQSALQSERDKAKTSEKALREMAKNATDPATADALRKQADEMKAERDAATAQLEFVTAAVKLGCRAPDKAWAVSQATGMSAEQLKADPDYSLAFFDRPKTPDARPGVGANGGGAHVAPAARINQAIRQAAGRPANL